MADGRDRFLDMALGDVINERQGERGGRRSNNRMPTAHHTHSRHKRERDRGHYEHDYDRDEEGYGRGPSNIRLDRSKRVRHEQEEGEEEEEQQQDVELDFEEGEEEEDEEEQPPPPPKRVEFDVHYAYARDANAKPLFRVCCSPPPPFQIPEKVYLRDLKVYFDEKEHGSLPSFDVTFVSGSESEYQKYFEHLRGGSKPKIGLLEISQGISLYLLPPPTADALSVDSVNQCAYKLPKRLSDRELGVSPDRRAEILNKNQHLRQNTLRTKNPLCEYDISELRRFLLPEDPMLPYRRRKGEIKSVNHWGQRKLLMSEIEFLTMYGEKDAVVVYAGAAPGTHTKFLSGMFEDLKFVLVDPSPFNCEKTERIEIRQEFFTDEIAAEFKECGKTILFISDIRTACHQAQNEKEIEKDVLRDMNWQANWHKIIQPKRSMLKFRLPYTQGKTQYLDGHVFLPVWGPKTTSEARLVVKPDAEMKTWDHQEYENHMFYFNTVTRVQYFEHKVQALGVDHCFDCASEIQILRSYLEKYQPDVKPPEMDVKIGSMMDSFAEHIADGRTLATIVSDDIKKKWFGKRTFDVVNKKIVNLDENSNLMRKRSRTEPHFSSSSSSHNYARNPSFIPGGGPEPRPGGRYDSDGSRSSSPPSRSVRYEPPRPQYRRGGERYNKGRSPPRNYRPSEGTYQPRGGPRSRGGGGGGSDVREQRKIAKMEEEAAKWNEKAKQKRKPLIFDDDEY